MKRLNSILGYNTKVVECVGKKLKDLLPNTDPWSGQPCGRQACILCGQDGDVKQNCRKRNVIYESKCELCNPRGEDKKKSFSLKDGRENPSIYVGETARSISERASEHLADYRSGAEESHILKHWETHHAGVGEPKFRFEVVKFCRDALTRQVGEATSKQAKAKAGYNRSGIARLTLKPEDDLASKSLDENERRASSRLAKSAEEGLQMMMNSALEQANKSGVKRLCHQDGARKAKKRRKLKHDVLEDWGLADTFLAAVQMLVLENQSSDLKW